MRIHINGSGSISAAGNRAAAAAVYRSGAPTWSKDEATGLPVYRNEDRPITPAKLTEFIERTRPDRATQLALVAAEDTVAQAGWRGEDFAIIVGCSRGPTTSWEREYDFFQEQGTARARTSPQTTLGGIGFALAGYFGTHSLASSLSVTCSSGFHGLLHGVALLNSGMVDRVLVGGAEAPLTGFTLAQMQALRIYAGIPERGQHACRPLAQPHSGMVIGEGAAFFALSRVGEAHHPIITGLGFSREKTTSATSISGGGTGLQLAMRAALGSGFKVPDLIVAHAPGTKRGDAAEREAINQVLGEAALDRTFSGKWATGHTFGASGPLGLDLALSYLGAAAGAKVGTGTLPTNVRSALINATGFGGNVVSLRVEQGE
ncbi:beta-ketoacyl synthase N-terminal-like domain-containing protein [Lewinella sp. 4G2]|uniref:beta-ketoacyl synthase N-terminal-like domain-containing protein n=1 Tax=Lewinella sp. 4G2 TaxID=1803372 RepID=UPI0007B4D9B4|nr:beta-ketoacyl synthase N-terminal-like domain-containing protein [Lewinella sp. 4G2]OAV43855.1 hypothetical protein A3850_004785 [Lewinella sp. 4G2]